MSVEKYTYTGICLQLADHKNYGKVREYLGNLAEDKGLEWIGDLPVVTQAHKNIQLIYDRMGGQYIYLFYVLSMIDEFSGTSVDTNKMYTIPEFLGILKHAEEELRKAYTNLGFTEPIKETDINFMTLDHYS